MFLVSCLGNPVQASSDGQTQRSEETRLRGEREGRRERLEVRRDMGERERGKNAAYARAENDRFVYLPC